jgi:hypothetical protein
MLEELRDKYLDEIRAIFPLHRIFLCILGFVCGLVVKDHAYKSVIESLVQIDLKSLSFEDGKLFENSRILHILLGIFLSLSAWITSRYTTTLFFKFILKKTRAKNKIETEQLRIKKLLSSARKDALEQIPYFEKQSTIASKKINRMANSGELFIGVSLCFGAVSFFGNSLDILVSLAFLLLYAIAIYLAILWFYSKYIKFDLLKSAVLGSQANLEIPAE